MSLVNITAKGWALTFLMKGFGLSKKLSIKDGFAFPSKGLKSKNLGFRIKKYMLISDLFLAYLLHICHTYALNILAA